MKIVTILVIVIFVIFMGLSALMYLTANKQGQADINANTTATWTEELLTGNIN